MAKCMKINQKVSLYNFVLIFALVKNGSLSFKLLLKSVFQQIIYKIHDLASAKAFFRSYIFHYFREFLSQVGNLKQKQFFINLSIHLIPNSNFMGKSRIHKVVLKEERGQQYYQQCQGLNLSYSFTMASARNFSSYFLFLQNKNERKETFRIDTICLSLKPLTRRRDPSQILQLSSAFTLEAGRILVLMTPMGLYGRNKSSAPPQMSRRRRGVLS